MGVSNFSVFTSFKAKDGVSPAFANMTQKAGKFGNKVQSQSIKAKAAMIALKNTAVAATAAIVAIGTAGFVPVKAFADWEKGILSVNTLMKQSEIKKYGKEIKECSKEAIRMGFAVEDANKGLFDTVSALGASKKAFDVYRSSIVLAKGGCTDLSIAIDGMTSVINAYGRETTDANFVANAFFTAQKYGKTTVEELATNVGKVAPIAKAAGVGLDELLATMAGLTLGGLSTDEATTALRGALSALIKPSKEAGETLQALGIPYGVMQIRQKGLAYTLQQLNKAQKTHPELIAKAIPNIRAYTAAMALSGDKLKIIDDTMAAIQNDAKNGTGLNEAFETMGGSGAATFSKVLGEVQVALIELGEILAPYLLPVAEKFGEMVHWLGEMSPKINLVIQGFKDFYDGAAGVYTFMKDNWFPLMLIMPSVMLGTQWAIDTLRLKMALLKMEGGLLSVVMQTKLMTALGGFTSGVWKSVTALWAQAAAFAATPIGLITIGIVALIGVVVLLATHWDVVTETVKKWWDVSVVALTGFWNTCKSVFGSVGGFIKTHFIDVLELAINPIGTLIKFIPKLASAIKDIKDDSDAIEISSNSTGKGNIKDKTHIKSAPSKGKIDVGVRIDNNTEHKANSTLNLQSPNNLNLQPR